MRKKLSLILCIAMIVSLMPATSVFAAKKVKSKSVSVAPKAMTLAVGDIAQLSAKMKPSNTTDKLKWSSSNKKVAAVSSKGVVQGVSEGTATITVKTTSKKTAKCVVTVKDYATDAEVRASLKEEFMKKDELQVYLDQNYYRKEEIDKKIKGASTDGFATKDELQALSQNTYTKSEVDSQISASEAASKDYVASEESIAAIREKLKDIFATNDSVLSLIKQNAYTKSEVDSKLAEISTDGFATKDELQALSQNTYTKSEIDEIISAITANGSGANSDWADGTSLTCLNESSLPLTKVYNRDVKGKNYSVTVTINNITCKKYRVMDYVDGYDQFVPYRYDIEVSYVMEGYDELREALYSAYSGADDEFDMVNTNAIIRAIGNGSIDLGTKLESGKTSETISEYVDIDCDAFYITSYIFEG